MESVVFGGHLNYFVPTQIQAILNEHICEEQIVFSDVSHFIEADFFN